jgi:hypothetical protein
MNAWLQSPASEIDPLNVVWQSFTGNARHNRESTRKCRFLCRLREQVIRLGEQLLDGLHDDLEGVGTGINEVEVIRLRYFD